MAKTTGFAAASLLATALSAALTASPAVAGKADKRLDVYWVDVEGGGATLIVTPAGESILIDAGNPGARDAGRIHKVATTVAGLTRIDHVVVTHLHTDHFGGVADLAGLMPVGAVYDNGLEGAPERERKDPKLAAYLEAKVGKRVVVKPGDALPLAKAPGAAPFSVRFLGGNKKFVAKGKKNAACNGLVPRDPDGSDNGNSIVTVVELGKFRFFDGGDLTWNTEGELVCPLDRVGAVDVYQTNHHGLDSSNNPVLVNTLRPTVAVFNNGPRKGCQPGAFAAVKAAPGIQAVYQVHKNLRDESANTAPELIANTEEACAGNHLALSVDPRGKSYTVTVPATGHSRTFQTK